ncbi:MAG: hypothetical protein II869_02520, partial [Synergistaceae bacterium]|nr:hypothetical protein [Synergistaceae bacterium]
MATKKKEKEKDKERENEKEESKSKVNPVSKGKDTVTDLLDMGSGRGYVTHDEIERHVPAE